MVSSVLSFEDRQTGSRLYELRKDKLSRQFDDFGAAFRRRDRDGKSRKKEPPFPAAFEVDNREASNRVDRSHSVSKEDGPSHT